MRKFDLRSHCVAIAFLLCPWSMEFSLNLTTLMLRPWYLHATVEKIALHSEQAMSVFTTPMYVRSRISLRLW